MDVRTLPSGKIKPYTVVVIISIILITIMSISILIFMSTRLQGNSTEFTEITEVLDNYRDLAELDIQAILQEDSTIYEITYSDLNELYTLNDKYQIMIDYNMTNPLNYTQQDFDELKWISQL